MNALSFEEILADFKSLEDLDKTIDAFYKENNERLHTAEEWKSKIPSDPKPYYGDIKIESYKRIIYNHTCSFPIITVDIINALKKLLTGKKVLDAGCARGYLVKQLRAVGIDITGMDHIAYPITWIDDIVIDDYDTADLSKYDVIILSWPYMGDESNQQLNLVNNLKDHQKLIYQGESFGGCTGTKSFHEALDGLSYMEEESSFLNESHIQFQGIHDRWHMYSK